MATTTSAVTEFLNELFARFGVPNVIVSDNGTQFTSEQFAVLCRKNGIQHFRISPYHPQSNGQAERFVDTLKRSLRKINEGEDISETLQTFLQVYRTTPSRVLNGKTPSQQMLGRNMRTVLDLLRHDQPKPVARNHRQDEQFNRKHGAVPRNFKKGDEVYAKVYTSNTKWQWASGVIIEVIGQVNHNVLLDNWHGRKKLIRSHSNQLKSRSSEEKSIEADPTPLGILVDMFGLQSTRASVQQSQPRSELIEELPAVANPAADQEVDEDEADSVQSEQAELEEDESQSDSQPEEDNQQSTGSVPESPSVRPQRMIRMPSRFEPYLFWK